MANHEEFLDEQSEYWSGRTESLMSAAQRNADISLDELSKAHQSA